MTGGEILSFIVGVACGAVWLAIWQEIHNSETKKSDKPSWHRGRFD